MLSVSKLTLDTKCIVTFTSTECIFQDQNKLKVLAVGAERSGLYHFSQLNHPSNLSDSVTSCNHVVSSLSNTSDVSMSKLWHLRLGNASHNVLEHIPCIGKHSCCNSDCPLCPIAKQSMLSFPKLSDSHASFVFDFIHMDVWGSYHISTHTGCKYFLTIVDDYSRATWTFFMSNKQHVFQLFKSFSAYVSN